MAETEQLREHATRLLAMALKARENGDIDISERLTARATELLEQAEILEHSASSARGLTSSLIRHYNE